MPRLALIIDDSRQAADSLAQILGLLDYTVRVAYSPSRALAELGQTLPDVVLLDINMPGVDGFEVFGFLKRDPRLAGVPVIFISSESQPETLARAQSSGAAGFIPKPASYEALEAALLKLFP
jgi:CheY-like chemotaxis protein